jgi:hypothetical protein
LTEAVPCYLITNIPNTRKNKNRKQTGNKNETEEKIGVRVVAFNAPFNNISVISWQSVLWESPNS